MSTGWKWIRDDGEEFKNFLGAVRSLDERPDSSFVYSELSMAGTKQTDATERVKAAHAAILGQRAKSENS